MFIQVEIVVYLEQLLHIGVRRIHFIREPIARIDTANVMLFNTFGDSSRMLNTTHSTDKIPRALKTNYFHPDSPSHQSTHPHTQNPQT